MKEVATLVGLAIGDALGNPFEMKPAGSPLLKEWDGFFKAGGTFWKGEAGQYTDDTLMSIALSKSLIQRQKFDPNDVAREYLYWYETKNTRGIGSTTAEAIFNLKNGAAWHESGLKGDKYGGNGTAMRVAPIGLAYRKDLEKLVEYAIQDSQITHNSLEPAIGSVAVAAAVAMLCSMQNKEKACTTIVDQLLDTKVKSKMKTAIGLSKTNANPQLALAELGTSGYVPETVGAAFFCLLRTSSFSDAVVMAVRGGGDTDTIAAITGAMAGTYYGMEGIPEHYRSVENFELLRALTKELMDIEA